MPQYVDPSTGEPVGGGQPQTASAGPQYVDPTSGEPVSAPPKNLMQRALDFRVPRMDMSTPPPADPNKSFGANMEAMLTTTPGEMLETLPGRAGIISTALGGPAAGAAAATLGEKVRQGARELAGLPKAPGVTQQLFGLDPNSPAASVAGLVAEGATAGLAGSAGRSLENTLKLGQRAASALSSLPRGVKTALSIGISRTARKALGLGPAGTMAETALRVFIQSPAAKEAAEEAVKQAASGNISKAARLFQGAASSYIAELRKRQDATRQAAGPMMEGS